MNVARSIEEFRALRSRLNGPIGLVPTMGYLHAGHLSLAGAARRQCASVVATIFVNPTQFAPTEDLSSYPQDLQHDVRLLKAAGTDLVFAPSRDDMYPPGYGTWIDVVGITTRLEGASRPTHFRGVATVVAKLFNIVRPDAAFFGQKDAQQALTVRQLIHDLNLGIELVVCPTVREPDGLAMSSRNTYLSGDERLAATVLYRALLQAETQYNEGERSADAIRGAMQEVLDREVLARPQYVSVADLDTLDEVQTVERPTLVSLAAYVGATRLIDNVILPPGEEIHP